MRELVDQIARLPLDAKLLEYFLGKVNEQYGSSAHEFLAPLQDAGFYRDVPGIVEEADGVRHQPWPAGRFLAQHAGAAPDVAFRILDQLPRSQNNFVLLDSMEAAALLPIEQLDRWVRKMRPTWHRVQYRSLFAERLGNLCARLLEGGRHRNALAVGRLLLRPTLAEGTAGESAARVARLRVDNHDVQRLVEQHLDRAIRANPRVTILFFAKMLERLLATWGEDHEIPCVPPSSWWHPAIENNAQNVYYGTPRVIYLNAVRDAADRAVALDLLAVEEVVSLLRARTCSVFLRIALHLVSRHLDSAIASDLLALDAAFLDPEFHHEYWGLAVSAFPRLPERSRRDLIQRITQGPGDEALRRIAQWGQDQPVNDAHIHNALAWWRVRRLVMLEAHLDASERALLVADEGITKVRPEHPEFLSYHESGHVGYTSPISIDELRRMTDGEMLEWLRRWQPEPRTEIDSPSREGLASMISQLATEAPARFAAVALGFLEVHPTYCRGLLTGMDRVLQQPAPSVDWRPVLVCIQGVGAKPPGGRADTDHDREEDRNWGPCRGEAARLLRTLAEKRAVGLEDRVPLWEAIAAFLHDPHPPADGVPSNEPLSVAINSVRGNAVEAAILYCCWLKSAIPNWKGLADAPEAREALDRHADSRRERSVAIHSLYGWMYSALFFMDAEWAKQARTLIFPTEPELTGHRDAAWTSYLGRTPARSAYFKALVTEYERAVNELGTRAVEVQGGRRPEQALGEHLVALYWKGAIELGQGSLLARFFATADEDLRAKVIEFAGRSILHADSVDETTKERLMRLWDARLLAGTLRPEAHRRELAEFGWWFATQHFPADGALKRIQQVLEMDCGVEPDFLFFERLSSTCEREPTLSVQCLWTYLEHGLRTEKLGYHRDRIRAVLAAGIRTSDEPTRRRVRELVGRFAQLGHPAFRSVLTEPPDPGHESRRKDP